MNKHRHENIKWKQVSKKPEIKKEVKTEKTKIETKSEVEITEPKTEISQTEVKKESAPEVAERTSKLEPENNSIKTIEVGSIEAISQHSGLSIQEKIEDLENYLKVFNSKKIESIWKFFL
ncbi:MAG: hypothetical protein B6229_05355 [Spirochaetaceae bacterium 4572_7]|nr:MAG: hypothetical protein B6229_05355 [Spirochaetaceae bacterium 4572_7]